MAGSNISIQVDTSEILEIMREIAQLSRNLGDAVPSHIKDRAQSIGQREGGFFEIRTETGADGQITIRIVPGHDLLSIWAVLMAHAPK